MTNIKIKKMMEGLQLMLESGANEEFLLEFQKLLHKYRLYKPKDLNTTTTTK